MFSVFRRASEVPLYRIEKNPKLARRQGAYSVISATGLIVRRGHELDRVLRVDRQVAAGRWWRIERSARSGRASSRPAQARAASARVSSQRPNLKPTSAQVADIGESRRLDAAPIEAV